MSLPGRDAAAIEALVTDRYLDALLALGDGGAASDGFVGPFSDGRRRTPLDRAVRLASDRLARDLPRFHPSFRFEERLAVRLAEAAAAMRAPAAVGAEGTVVALPISRRPGPGHDPAALAALLDDEPDGLARIPRPLLVGGAVAASAISIAGAAWMAWRRSRAATPMGRAARAAHALRAQGERAGTLGTGR